MLTVHSIFPFLLLFGSWAYSAKILGVFTVPSLSHQLVFQPIWKELSLRGHKVTVLTPNPLNDPTLINLNEIDLSFLYKDELKLGISNGVSHWTATNLLTSVLLKFTREVLQNDKIQNFIKDDFNSYDLVLVESMDPVTYAFAAKYNCPFIGVASLSVPNPTHGNVGNPQHSVLYPDLYTPYYGGKMSFFEKVDAVLFDWYQSYIRNYKHIPAVNFMVKKYFYEAIPDVKSVEKNMSMLFVNTNPIIHGARPYGPSVIEFGDGIHLKPPKPLPLELRLFLDNATEGVVYFSLGTNIKSKFLPEDRQNIIKKTFGNLPYQVLWKFENDKLEERPKNVKISKWLPQQDLLRHPNIKLFITQAGLQSTQEALINGVPLIALPFMGDQLFNAKSIDIIGVGKRLNIHTITEEDFHSSILEVIKNPTYKQRAVEIGKLLKDQPMTGLEKVVWWSEYVIRNKGAPHLRPPGVNMSWTEHLILDVMAFLLFILIASGFLAFKITWYASRLILEARKLKKK